MAKWDEGIDEWSRPNMRDEGDLYARPRITWRVILGCLISAIVIYLLLTAILVLIGG